VLCVLVTFLTRFWCLAMSVRGMKYESWHSIVGLCLVVAAVE
jgi:hypothetical protein